MSETSTCHHGAWCLSLWSTDLDTDHHAAGGTMCSWPSRWTMLDGPSAHHVCTNGALGVGVGRDEFGFERESLTLTAELNFDVTDTIMLSSLTGYNDEESHFLADWDETNNPSTAGYDLVNAREFESFSQELRLTGSSFDDRLDWSIGVN